MSSPVLSPITLRPPYSPANLVDPSSGIATQQFNLWLQNLTTVIKGLAGYSTTYYGAPTTGTSDAQPDVQTAINDVVNAGGGTLIIGVGTFLFEEPLVIPATDQSGNPTGPIFIQGQGDASIILRGATIPAGMGMIDISASGVSMENFVIDGNTAGTVAGPGGPGTLGYTQTVGLQYGVGFNTALTNNDPMAPSLTLNTSIWLHGPTADLSMTQVRTQHSGGYPLLIDCMTGNISDVHLVRCQWFNNRAASFGTTLGQLIYGSWNGAIYVNGDGRTANSGVLDGLLVDTCHFSRNNGNCLWSHLYGLNGSLHQDFRIIGCFFEDCGLDGVEIGGVTGGIVGFNVFRRVGYTTTDDTSQSTPRWLQNLNATAIDTTGLAKGVNYIGNTMLSVNGGCLDLDGFCDGVVSGNTCRIPYVGEIEYSQDQTQITGGSNAGSTSYGVNLSNTSNTAWGAQNITITGNQFINLVAGSIRLYAGRNCLVTGNNIEAPPNSIIPPISMGPIGAGPYQRCYGNKITANKFDYNTTTGTPPCVYEDSTYAAFTSGEVNTVCNNVPITPASTTAIEFEKAAGSGSTVFSMQIWFP